MPALSRAIFRMLVLAIAFSAAATVLVVAVAVVRGKDDSDLRADPMLFGTTLPPMARQNASAVLSEMRQRTGEPQVVRVFSRGLPTPWSGSVSNVGDIPAVASFKADPTAILEGRYDDALTTWFASAPRARPTFWAYYHEPEDEVEAGTFTAEQFREAWLHVEKLAAGVDNPNLHSTVILMCWTLNSRSGRDWTDYVLPDTADVVAWDCYNHRWKTGSYVAPADLLEHSVQASAEVGSLWAVAELGSQLAAGDHGTGRADWLRDVGSYAQEHGAAFITYFDSRVGGNFALDDAPSRQAVRELVS